MENINEESIPLIAGTVLLLFLVVFIILFIILYNKAQLQFKFERQQFQQDLLTAEFEIKEQTLNNVSQELHDNIGQIASLLKINLNKVIQTLPLSQRPIMNESSDLIKQLISDVKETSTSLKGNRITEIGLLKAIEQDYRRIKKLELLNLELEISNSEMEPGNTTSIFLIRIYQELINNVLTHSQATHAKISLNSSRSNFTMTIEDNGIGFLIEKTGNGNGLKNLKERCNTIGARLNLESYPNNGTKTSISLPLV